MHIYFIDILQRLRRDTAGVTILEYAVAVPVFVLLVMGALEFSMIMFASSALHNAVAEVGRLAVTGSNYEGRQDLAAGDVPLSRGAYIRSIYRKRLGPLRKMGTLHINVARYATLEDAGAAPGSVTTVRTFGTGGAIVEHTASFDWKLFSPILMPFGDDGIYHISASTVVQNEDF